MRVILIVLLMSLLAPVPARAVVILESTWAENGGTDDAPADGFDAHVALAQDPAFAALVGLWDGEGYGGSGTWIGNDADGHGYVLTSAHNFDEDPDPTNWTYITTGGAEFGGLEVWIHPDYDHHAEDFGGADLAIVKLDGPVTDAGDPALLYGGRDELGRVVTITGYGARGIGSTGEADEFYAEETPAAARNVIDDIEKAGGLDQLVVDFDSEAGDANALDGDAMPVDAFEGILGSGDSGGPTWIETAGGWAVAGVNSWGDDSVYGSTSGMTRVSTQADWIRAILPDAAFTD